jgi:hypothetical protein
MFNRIHQKLGTAGFIISIVALVAALGGGAYAASGGLNGKQKKEVEKIAKKFSGKPGAAGATGPGGPAGAGGGKGDAGAPGANGTGTAGANGESVTISSASVAECEHGGAKFTNKTGTAKACSAPSGGGFPEALPEGATETGTLAGLSISGQTEGAFYLPMSFSVPLEAGLGKGSVRYVTVAEQTAHSGPNVAACAGSVEDPTAEEGALCVYEGAVFLPPGATLHPLASGATSHEAGVLPPGVPQSGEEGTGISGAVIHLRFEEGDGESIEFQGSWAVTG